MVHDKIVTYVPEISQNRLGNILVTYVLDNPLSRSMSGQHWVTERTVSDLSIEDLRKKDDI